MVKQCIRCGMPLRTRDDHAAGDPATDCCVLRDADRRARAARAQQARVAAPVRRRDRRRARTPPRRCPCASRCSPIASRSCAIREASERDEAMVFAFLRAHAGELPRGLAREASAKLSPAHRALIVTC